MWRARTAEYVRLLPYPADIWRDSCDEWATTPDRGRWYPTVAELAALMAPRLTKRRNVVARLRRMAEIAEQPVEREWTPPTEAEKARVASIVADYYAAKATSDAALDTGTPHAAEGR